MQVGEVTVRHSEYLPTTEENAKTFLHRMTRCELDKMKSDGFEDVRIMKSFIKGHVAIIETTGRKYDRPKP